MNVVLKCYMLCSELIYCIEKVSVEGDFLLLYILYERLRVEEKKLCTVSYGENRVHISSRIGSTTVLGTCQKIGTTQG